MPRGSLCSGRGLTLRRWRAGGGQGAAGSRSIRWIFGRTEFFFTIRCDGRTDKKCLETFAYREIAAPERIVFVNSLADEKGGTARSPYHPKRPLEIRNTLTLTEHEGKTTLNLRGGPINATEEECNIFQGLPGSHAKGIWRDIRSARRIFVEGVGSQAGRGGISPLLQTFSDIYRFRFTEERGTCMQLQTAPISQTMLWTGRIMSTVPVLLTLLGSVMKLAKVAPALEGMARAGFPERFVVPIGILELICVAAYVMPQTSVLGAILLTGLLGGATVTTLRIGDPTFPLPVVLGMMAWGGLYLRDGRLRELIPLRKM